MLKGQVVKINAGFYYVMIGKKIYTTRGSGNLRNTNQSPVVGDIVNFENEGFVFEIMPRKNLFDRPKVANIDQAIIITSMLEPKYNSLLLNKFIAIFESKNIKPIIIFTKIDLVKSTPAKIYKDQGYETYELSNKDLNIDITKIRKIFKNKLSAFVGQTGAGKSSTINSLADLSLKTQLISKALGRGKHTTRVTEIIEWEGGRLIDTPGFSSLEFNLTEKELSIAYHDFRLLAKSCKFRSCIHTNEKDCAVKQAVEKGEIVKERYNDYVKIMQEVKNGENRRVYSIGNK